MTTIPPRHHKDLTLAPVAAAIDLNLQRIRDRSARDVEAELELQLDRPAMSSSRDERAQYILDEALRNLDMHGWTASISADGFRVHLEGGSVSLDLGLSAGITEYIQDGLRR